MEWWALVPPELLPPKRYSLKPGPTINSRFDFPSHSAPALALWRGKFPAQVELVPVTKD
ncbi:hypothetical protein Pan153_14760 [Gimesia panareensis]|uniref:Uncharacterized protein n=1 Tax=Gimesia panareensis TaxID=2527978 RepID=A0A518FKK8_9PLAN|nr:hypothetical protein Pan153_14760 [Gimesia panareensis]